MSDTPKRVFKIVLIGEGSVGKTSIRKKYMGHGFRSEHIITLGADFSEKKVKIMAKGLETSCSLQIWDIAGQETFKTVRSRFLTRPHGVLAVFDLTNRETFNMIPKWLSEIWRINKSKNYPILLIGNKYDLDTERKVNFKEGLEFSKLVKSKYEDIPFIDYIETSALTGHNIEHGFQNIVNTIIDISP